MTGSFVHNYLKRKVVKNVLYFVIITVGFHFFFRYWAIHWTYWPIKNSIAVVYQIVSKIVFEQSAVVVNFLMGNKVSLLDQQFIFINQGIITIGSGCSGLKQMLQFLVLFVFIRGSFRKKLWFIPLGILAMHLTNLFRIICLSLIIFLKAEYWQFSHDYLFRPLFYFVIFIFWVIWIEKSIPQKTKNQH